MAWRSMHRHGKRLGRGFGSLEDMVIKRDCQTESLSWSFVSGLGGGLQCFLFSRMRGRYSGWFDDRDRPDSTRRSFGLFWWFGNGVSIHATHIRGLQDVLTFCLPCLPRQLKFIITFNHRHPPNPHLQPSAYAKSV